MAWATLYQDILLRVLLTVALLVVVRCGLFIPLPGLDFALFPEPPTFSEGERLQFSVHWKHTWITYNAVGRARRQWSRRRLGAPRMTDGSAATGALAPPDQGGAPWACVRASAGERLVRALYGQARALPASLFELGISPFINASILVTLVLAMPEQLVREDGERGAGEPKQGRERAQEGPEHLLTKEPEQLGGGGGGGGGGGESEQL